MPFIPDQPKRGFTPDKKSIGGFMGNVVNSTGKLVEDTAKAIFSPVETAKNIYKLGSGIVQLAIPGEQGNEQLARAVGKFYADRYGGLDKAWNSFYSDPAGVAADISTVLGIGAGTFKLAGANKLAGGLSKASKVVDPLNVASKLPNGTRMPNITKKIGANIQDLGENMAFSGLHDPKIQKNIRKVSGKTPLQLSNQYKTWSRNPESVEAAISDINSLRTSKLKGKKVDLRDVMSDIDRSLNLLEGDISDNANIGRQYLNRKKEEIAKSLVRMGEPEMLPDTGFNELNPGIFRTKPVQPAYTPLYQPAEKIVELRKQISKDIPDNSWSVGSADSAKGEAAKQVYRTFKERINQLDPSLAQSGKDESALIMMKKLFENEQARKAARNSVSLGDQVIGAGTFAAGGLPTAVGTLLAKRAITSPKGVEVVSKAFTNTGKAMQKAKLPPVAKNVFSAAYKAGKAARMINEPSRQSKLEAPKTSQTKLPQSYKTSLPQDAIPTKQIKVKSTSNVFKNKSSYGRVPRLKMGSFV